MYSPIDNLKFSVLEEINSGNLNKALELVKEFVESIIASPFTVANIFGSPVLDELCQKIGHFALEQRRTLKFALKATQLNKIIYVVTQLYVSGGHTAVIEDFINLQPDKQHVILVNDMLHTQNKEEIENRFAYKNVKIIWSPKGAYLESVLWLQNQFFELQADRIYLFNHNQDSVAIAAIQPEVPSEVFFYHHADHNFCLGLYLDYVIHIDSHNMGFFNCRENLKIKNNIYLPLTSEDLSCRDSGASFLTHGSMRTCSSGSPHKFYSPYLFKYSELIPQLLKITGGTHIHIGHLEPHMLKGISKGLKNLNIPLGRFVWVPWVKSVWRYLVDHNIDLYITSFPYGGGKVAIEVMGSGTPIIFHENYKSQFLGGGFMIYPEAFCWREPIELFSQLNKINKGYLLRHSLLARKFYEKNYIPFLLKNEINKIDGKSIGLAPPILQEYIVDKKLFYFDLYLQFKELYEKYDAVRLSKLWRITKPLRFLKKILL